MVEVNKPIIGRAEVVSFVNLQLENIPAKVDSGAFRSAVHADKIKLSKDGTTLSFRLLGAHPIMGGLAETITTKHFKKVRVENSFGHRQKRYSVQLPIRIHDQLYRTEFTLANRSKKIYPILLGRRLLSKRFLIDTSMSTVDRLELKRKFGIEFPKDKEQVDK